MSSRRRHRGRGLAATLAAAMAGPLGADVVFDGSLGPVGALFGDMVIGEEWGARQGANLFHSFLYFDVNAGESATFTASFAGATDNVFARVTGGRESLIDGPLRVDIPGASLWLINPSGLVFGQGAVVDVQGAFTATTAAYVLLGDGGRFAADPAALGGTVLTMGNPTGFGFLDATPAAIRLQGAEIRAGEGVTLAGGELSLRHSEITAPGGRVDLVSAAAAGEVGLGGGALDTAGIAAHGAITLHRSTIDVDGEGGGRIRIVGGRLVVENQSALSARSADADGMGVELAVDELLLRGASLIDTATEGDGDAGEVAITASGDIRVAGGSLINTATHGRGDAGDVGLTAGGTVSIRGAGAESLSGISANSFNRGDAGDIRIEADTLEMSGAAYLQTRARSVGDAGDISVIAASAIRLAGMSGGRTPFGQFIRLGAIDASSDATNAGRIHLAAPQVDIRDFFSVQSNARGNGDGGSIVMEVDDLWMRDGAQLAAETGNDRRASGGQGGAAGSIVINASGRIRLSNSLKFDEHATNTSISVNAQRGGRSGFMELNARTIDISNSDLVAIGVETADEPGRISLTASESVTLRDGSIISTEIHDSDGLGADIVITAPVLTLLGETQVSTNSFQSFGTPPLKGGAGSIYIAVDELHIRDSVIEASTCGCSAGSAGNIYVEASSLISISGLFQPGGRDFGAAGIRSQSFGGETGGNIFIRTGELRLAEQGAISTSSPATAASVDAQFPGLRPGNAGSIDITAERLYLDSGASIATTAVDAAGGIISLGVSELIVLRDAAITADAQGVQAGDDGGNIFITEPSAIVLDGGSIVARANAGNGGNIGIVTGALIPGLYGRIDASSRAGLDGEVVIESPNQQVTSVTVLDAPSLDVTALVQDPCQVVVGQPRSSLTVEGQGGLPPGPDDYLPAPLPMPARGGVGAGPDFGQAGVLPAACAVAAP